MLLLCCSDWPWMFKQKWPQPPKSWEPGSTDVHQHFWLGPQFVEISGVHFRSPIGCIWLEQMFVRCDHPEWFWTDDISSKQSWIPFRLMATGDQVLPVPFTSLPPVIPEGKQRGDAFGSGLRGQQQPLNLLPPAWCWLWVFGLRLYHESIL